jgi:hypothetical protein
LSYPSADVIVQGYDVRGEKRRLRDEIEEIALHCAALPLVDPRHADDIIGYDPHGIPGLMTRYCGSSTGTEFNL